MYYSIILDGKETLKDRLYKPCRQRVKSAVFCSSLDKDFISGSTILSGVAGSKIDNDVLVRIDISCGGKLAVL